MYLVCLELLGFDSELVYLQHLQLLNLFLLSLLQYLQLNIKALLHLLQVITCDDLQTYSSREF